jgi:hypothetical protein
MELNKQYVETFQLVVTQIKTSRIAITRQMNAAVTGGY